MGRRDRRLPSRGPDAKAICIGGRFAPARGKVQGAATGAAAGDSYHRYKEDIALRTARDLKSYRCCRALQLKTSPALLAPEIALE